MKELGKLEKMSLEKGQVVIIEFILFFVVGMTLFVLIGNFFRYQSDIFKNRIIDSSTELVSSYLSSISITMVDACKECDKIKYNAKINPTTANYFLSIILNGDGKCNGITVATAPIGMEFTSSIHNLNYSIACSGEAPSIEPINLTYDRTQNILSVV